MPNQNQPSRYQSSMLAAGLAVAGILLVYDKLGYLVRGALSAQVVLPAAGILMIAAGICLLLIEWPERKSTRSERLRRRTRLGSERGVE